MSLQSRCLKSNQSCVLIILWYTSLQGQRKAQKQVCHQTTPHEYCAPRVCRQMNFSQARNESTRMPCKHTMKGKTRLPVRLEAEWTRSQEPESRKQCDAFPNNHIPTHLKDELGIVQTTPLKSHQCNRPPYPQSTKERTRKVSSSHAIHFRCRTQSKGRLRNRGKS